MQAITAQLQSDNAVCELGGTVTLHIDGDIAISQCENCLIMILQGSSMFSRAYTAVHPGKVIFLYGR